MSRTSIAIVGGGLSGLYAAFLLSRHRVDDYLILEARGRLGGRIESFAAPGHITDTPGAGFDLGPTWFWPGDQPQLDRLVDDLGLPRLAQFEDGDMVVERRPGEPPVRTRGYATVPASMRIDGGMGRLIDALRGELDPARIATGQTVRWLRCRPADVEVDSEDESGRTATRRAAHVLLAVPPRLAEAGFGFTPGLPASLSSDWRSTATWMAPHAKYLALYDTPFWREHGLSGEARSASGPLAEIHDASMPSGGAALFGFFGVPVRVRHDMSDDVMRTHCRAQLARLFGPEAATPRADVIKDWALDPQTATPADAEPLDHHAEAPAATVASGPWHGRLTGIASEWSPQHPGYLAGAIEAATRAVAAISASR